MTHYLLSDADSNPLRIRKLAKLFQFPKTVQDDGFVIKTVPLGVVSQVGACVVRTHLARKPFRLIVARFPELWEVRPDYWLVHYLDTLSCGHQVITYSGEEFKKRRGCQACLDALAIPLSRKEAA